MTFKWYNIPAALLILSIALPLFLIAIPFRAMGIVADHLDKLFDDWLEFSKVFVR